MPAREHLIAHQAAGPLRCEVCGQEPKAGGKSKVVKWNGRVVMVCGDCLKRGSRRWWEFWKR